nr:hypothetical protein [Nitrososphaerota archaeon]
MSSQSPDDFFRELTLKRKGPIKDPWPIELEVLGKFSNSLKDDRRVAIELPTGSGKSIIGLVLLEFYRKLGKRVAILTSSLALGDTMYKRCLDLGIEGAIITGKRKNETEALARVQNKRKYARKAAIGIMNYWSYMMGDDIPTADILVVDDADFFENFLASYYSVVVSRKRDSYIWGQLMDALDQYKIYQASIETFKYNVHSDETLLVYFIHSIEMAKKLRTLALTSPGSVSRELSFSLGPNHDSVESYLMFVTGDEIVFTPFITPGLNNERLRSVEKIILMSATIGSSAGIHRTLGSAEQLTILAEKDVKSKVGTMGKRIVFPIDGISPSSKIDDSVLSAIDSIFAKFAKALVICNSKRDAEIISKHLEDKGIIVINYEADAELAAFSSAKNGALIAAGRYVGIDLPDEACRVVIVPKMPFVI